MLDALFTADRQQRFVKWTIRHRLAVLVLATLVTAGSLVFATRLKLDSNLIALLPENTPSVLALKEMLAKTGGYGDLMVMFECPDPDASVRYAESLLPKIRKLDWVGEAEIGQNVTFFEKSKLLYMDLADLKTIQKRVDDRLEFEKVSASPLFIDLDAADDPPPLDFSDIEAKYKGKGKRRKYYQSDDGKILLMVVLPSGVTSDLPFVRRIYNELKDLVEASDPKAFHPELKATVGGTFKNRLNEFATIIGDVKSSTFWVALGLILLISFYFRHPLAFVVIAIPLGMSISWAFALGYVFVGSLNLITVFLVIILMGLSIDFGIHMFARFQEERRQGRDLEAALQPTIGHAGRASLIAALTTALSFFTLVVTDFRGFSDFGVIAGSGLVAAAIVFIFVFPAILAYVYQWGLIKPKARKSSADSGKPLRHPGRLVTVSVLLTVGALAVAPNVAFEYDFRNFRSRIPETYNFNVKITKVFSKARDPSAVLVKDAQEAAEVVAVLKERQQAGGDTSPIEAVNSINDMLPQDVDAKLDILAYLRKQIDKVLGWVPEDNLKSVEDFREHLDVVAIRGPNDLPAKITRPFFGRNREGGQFVYIFQRYSLMDFRNALAFSEVVSDIEVKDKVFQPASEPLVYADMLRVIERDTPIALALCSLALALLVFSDLRSIRATALVFVPLTIGVVWMVGFMALIPLKLNIMNAAVLPSVLGLGVDGGVHMYHRWRELGWRKMTAVIRETGGAVVACTGTSIIGFGGMISAAHPGLRSIAYLAMIGLGCCLVGAIVVLPAFLAVLGQRKEDA